MEFSQLRGATVLYSKFLTDIDSINPIDQNVHVRVKPGAPPTRAGVSVDVTSGRSRMTEGLSVPRWALRS